MRDAEIEEAQHARALGDQQVGGLHVAMHDAALVGVTEAGTELREPMHLARQRHLLAAANDLRHRPAGDELHRQVRIALVLTDRVNADDMRVMDARREAGLAQESPPGLLVGYLEDLDRHRPVEHRVEPEIHDAHAALTEAVPYFIRSDMSWKLVHADVQPYFKRSAHGPAHSTGPFLAPTGIARCSSAGCGSVRP